ncbi:MAG: DNA-directed RNA polymerase subunit beta' [Candidatus Hydrogenedentota bacterium]
MEPRNVAAISIKLASPEKIITWSNGEVKKPETINYRTLKPERDGLFCEKIFGCIKDWECSCGSLKTIRYRGVRCERCGVEVTHSKVRRERMGHIKLVAPVTHIWYLKGTTSRIGILLDIPAKELERVVYFEKYIVIESQITDKPVKSLISIEEYEEKKNEWGDNIVVGIGAEGIKEVLKKIDLEKEKKELLDEIEKSSSKQKAPSLSKRLALIKAFLESGNKPEWMVLDVIPVIPPDLRPMVQLDGGRFATSDLNDLYRRVINRNNRLKRLKELKAPKIIIRNEMRMLQEAVDALFDNGRRGRKVLGSANRPLKSLTDMLRGKQGRFRQNLLGKRVDYSGRSVIVVGPELPLSACGLPKKMALELFTPFVMHRLVAKDIVSNIKSAKRYIDQEKDEVWDALDEVIKEHPVLLNRAPTLHRLGIQSFQPILIEGKAIRLHPLVCVAFNADFDGDQMAVHVPLSKEAIMEAELLMLSRHNILSPANGKPIIGPTQDIVLGIYYLTKEKTGSKGTNKIFASKNEALRALDEDIISIHAPISVKLDGKLIKTTVGRIVFNNILPQGYSFQNKLFGKADLNKLIYDIFLEYGADETVKVADAIKDLGFYYSTKSGISLGVTDMLVPKLKNDLIRRANDEVFKVNEQYKKGIISDGERYDKLVNIWEHTTKEVSRLMLDEMEISYSGFNPIYIMAISGARGGKDQIKQLAGMRGLMADPSGKVKEIPIISNFREGLSVYEFYQSTSGSRKGLTDTALKTANAGYLTRRLVDVAQDIIVIEEDCGTLKGLTISIRDLKTEDESFFDKIAGRVALEDVIDIITNEVIVKAGELIDEEKTLKISNAGVEEIKTRSVLTCESPRGICSKCYGRDLGTGRMIEAGEAVGIIAAQSIGEPGTQLTLRTFHVGGVASVEDNFVRALFNGRITKMPVTKKQKDGSEPVVGEDYILGKRIGRITIDNKQINFLTSKGRTYEQGLDSNMKVKILVKNGDRVDIDKPVVRIDYISPYNGKVAQFHLDTVLIQSKGQNYAFRIPITFEKNIEIGKEIDKGSTIAYRDFKTNFCSKVEIEEKEDKRVILLISESEEPISGIIQRQRLVEAMMFIGSELRIKIGNDVKISQIIGENPNYKPIFTKINGMIEVYNVQLQKEHNEYSVIRPEVQQGRETEQGTIIVWKGKDFLLRGEVKIKDGEEVDLGTKLSENVVSDIKGRAYFIRTYKTKSGDNRITILRIVEDMEKYPLPYLRYTGTTTGTIKKVSKIKKSIIKLISKTNVMNPTTFKDYEKIHKDLENRLQELDIKRVEDKDSIKKHKYDFEYSEYNVPNISKLDEIETIEHKLINTAKEKLRVEENELLTKQFSDFFKFGRRGEGAGRQRGITQDIVTGLPRVEELFEVRKPKTDPAIVTEIEGEVEVPDDFSLKRTIKIVNKEIDETREYKIPMEKQLIVNEGDYVEAGDPLTDGPIDLHTMLKVQGEMAVQRYIVKEIQDVYKQQGVYINDKHIEVIVKQMMRKVRITDPGNTRFIEGEEVDSYVLKQENERVKKEKKAKPAKYEILLKGITNVSKHSESFISAASFQETPWALTEAAIKGKKDELFGLKENVIIGHLIPAGTGFRGYRDVDFEFEGKEEVEKILEEKKKEEEKKAEAKTVKVE